MAKIVSKRTPLTAGVVAATLTPMYDDGRPNGQLLYEHCRRLLEQGCTSIVLLGTTGEANSFSVGERKGIVEDLLHAGFPAEALIAGTGCCALDDTVSLSTHALSCGISRLLVLPPFYYKKVSDEGLFLAFARVFESIADRRLRVYLYQIPQVSGVDLSPALIDRLLAAFPDVVCGIKDSSGNWPAIEALCRRFGERLDVLVGSETMLLPAVEAGASGCVSATANVNAAAIARLFQERNDRQAKESQKRVSKKRAVFEKHAMIPALKGYLAFTAGNDGWRNLRPPLVRLSDSEISDLAREADRADDCS